jgi:hypothetical protein
MGTPRARKMAGAPFRSMSLFKVWFVAWQHQYHWEDARNMYLELLPRPSDLNTASQKLCCTGEPCADEGLQVLQDTKCHSLSCKEKGAE